MKRILKLVNILLHSVNQKYEQGYKGRLRLSDKYRNFKKYVAMHTAKIDIEPPYRMYIEADTWLDIDNFLKPTIDGIFENQLNDKLVERMNVRVNRQKKQFNMKPKKRLKPTNNIECWIGNVNNKIVRECPYCKKEYEDKYDN